MRLDVRRSAELSALVRALATIPREVAREVRQQSKAVIVPEWKRALAERSPDRIFSDRLVRPATAYVSDRNVKLIAGSNKANAFPRETEFGAYREDFTEYARKGHAVRRRTKRQFWHYVKTGRVVIPTVAEMIPRIAALWVQTGYRTIAETIERSR